MLLSCNCDVELLSYDFLDFVSNLYYGAILRFSYAFGYDL